MHLIIFKLIVIFRPMSLNFENIPPFFRVSSNGYIDGLEIGNECDFYRSDGIRAPDYTIWDYISESKGVVSAIETVVPMPMIQGKAAEPR